MKLLLATLLSAPLAVAANPPTLSLCPNGGEAVQAVEGYITSMQEHRFADAYDFVSEAMTDGRPRHDWKALQETFFERGGIEIYGFEPRSAVSVEDDGECTKQAIVPNILRSRDRFNVEGIVEFELYTVIRDNLDWRIDGQETLYDENSIQRWFPDVEIVDVSMSEDWLIGNTTGSQTPAGPPSMEVK